MNRIVKDWLAMGRVANLPTVVSNVVLGCGLGIFARSWEFDWFRIWVPVAAGCLLYLGGCYLNDWWDRKWDAVNKPDRPAPSGRVNGKALLTVALLGLTGGVAMSCLLGVGVVLTSLAIVASIVIYTAFHKKTAWMVIPMGLCRGLLYVLGFIAQPFFLIQGSKGITLLGINLDVIFSLQQVVPAAIGLTAYIAGLSLFARAESQPVVPRTNVVQGIFLMGSAILTHTVGNLIAFPLASFPVLLIFCFGLVLAIKATRECVPIGVSKLLASIALVDLIATFPLAFAFHRIPYFQSQMLPLNGFFFPLISIAAFLLALLLQRLAPAT